MKNNHSLVVKTIAKMIKFRQSFKGTVGFVPTMGYLHEGHMSLIKMARKENDHVVVSIFVNPTQFGLNEDYSRYPRDTKRDLELLTKNNVDVVFLPTVEELYPKNYETYVIVDDITTRLEGKSRPTHFRGVTTIVTKLFNIIQPNRAYFGQKDAQQAVVIKKMVADLNMPIEIIVGEIVRESDGLAMSSRNVYLYKIERNEAVVLSQSLQLAKAMFTKGERNCENIKTEMKKLINKTSGLIDYVSIANTKTLLELKVIKNEALVSMAVRFGKTRLIDNIVLKESSNKKR